MFTEFFIGNANFAGVYLMGSTHELPINHWNSRPKKLRAHSTDQNMVGRGGKVFISAATTTKIREYKLLAQTYADHVEDAMK